MKKDYLYRNKGYWTAHIQMELFDVIKEYMTVNKLNRTELAKQLGVSKGYITQVLNGDFDHKISKFVELALAVNKVPKINYLDLNELIEDSVEGISTVYWSVKIKKEESLLTDISESTESLDVEESLTGDITQPLVSNYS